MASGFCLRAQDLSPPSVHSCNDVSADSGRVRQYFGGSLNILVSNANGTMTPKNKHRQSLDDVRQRLSQPTNNQVANPTYVEPPWLLALLRAP